MLDQSQQQHSPAAPLAEREPEAPLDARRERLAWAAVAVITLLAGTLRLWSISRVPLDPFYDAAVKSMTLSWHNFFFGAMEPGGSVSIDKPPVDLWLQVASVKLFGFSATSLMLPEALIGTASVPLIYAALRRIWSMRAGLLAALVLAVLPIEVITSRSDTMDAVMMTLVVLALLWIARAAQSDSTAWLLLAAAALGLAFDVKLTESLVALPGLLVFAWLALPGPPARRLVRLLAAGAVYLLVALAWLLGTLAFPASQRPFAYGSTNGSAWNAALVLNGIDRLEGKATPGQEALPAQARATPPPSRYASLTQAERDHVPIRPPSVTRLLDRVGPLSGARLGLEVLAALLLGLPALLSAFLALRSRSGAARARIRFAGLLGLVVWLLTGAVLFSQMAHLHPRYTEVMVPAVAGTLAIGLAWATERRSAVRLGVLAAVFVVLVAYGEQLLFGTTAVWWVMFVSALAALATMCAGTLAARGRDRTGRGSAWAALLGLVLVTVSLLAVPAWASVRAVEDNVSDTNQLGVVAPGQLAAISSYLRAHQGSARYEAAYDSASKIGSLVVHDARPLIVLNTVDAQVVTPLARLRALIRAGEVRYAVLTSTCGRFIARDNADCSEAARWISTHGTNVSEAAGLGRRRHPNNVWLLPGARPGA